MAETSYKSPKSSTKLEGIKNTVFNELDRIYHENLLKEVHDLQKRVIALEKAQRDRELEK